MALKVVLDFSVAPSAPFASLAGWSETFYNFQNKTPAAKRDELVAGTDKYLERRCDLLTTGWRCARVRVYSTEALRVVAKRTVNITGRFPVSSTDPDEQPYDRLLYTVNSENRTRSARLGGIPKVIVDPGGNYTGETAFGPSPAFNWNAIFQTPVDSFLNALITNQYAIRHGTISAPYLMTDVETENTGGRGGSPRTPVLVFTGDVSAVFAAGKTVRVSEVSTPAGLNGQWTIVANSVVGGSTYVKLFPKRKKSVAGAYAAGGYAVVITYGYEPVVGGGPERGVSRKPGRPFGLPRGRRSNRTS